MSTSVFICLICIFIVGSILVYLAAKDDSTTWKLGLGWSLMAILGFVAVILDCISKYN